MPQIKLEEPPGYRELCARLQVERNPAKFRMLLEEINHLLGQYEEAAALQSSSQSDSPVPSLEVLVSASATIS